MQPRRQARINELIKHAVGEIVNQGLKTRFEGLITITNVKASPDLSVAWVDFTVIGADDEAARKFLEYSRHEIISKMAQKIRLRALPKLKFAPDRTLKNAQRIDDLIREINQDE